MPEQTANLGMPGSMSDNACGCRKTLFWHFSITKFARKLLNVRSRQALKFTEITALVPFSTPTPDCVTLLILQANRNARICIQWSMQMEAHISAGTIDRLEEQSALLQRIYQAEFAKDPTSPATESSRSNMIALRHSINQIYGEASASDVADALGFATDDRPLKQEAC